MKIIIFAGGTGTRLWPLSRKEFPKQFKKMFDGKSTLDLALDRVTSQFGLENIYLSTNIRYQERLLIEFPNFPKNQIIFEPDKRDLAPAVGLNLIHLKNSGYTGSVAILWADHLMKNVDEFIRVLKNSESLTQKHPEKICFIAEKPRFANNNLGWIKLGKESESGAFEFLGWKYKPEISDCVKMFNSREWFWNPGYFVFDLDNMLHKFERYQPKLFNSLNKIKSSINTSSYQNVLSEVYPTLEKINFDKAIAEKISLNEAWVLKADMDWSDPGTLFALKEALVGNNDSNYLSGLVHTLETKNSLVINEDSEKVLTTVGLEGFVVVNTKDALIIVPKDKVVDVSKLVEELEKSPDLQKFI